MNLPSVKKINDHLGKYLPNGLEDAKLIRQILEFKNRHTLADFILENGSRFPDTHEWVRECYNILTLLDLKLSTINEIMEAHGVEYTPAGRNKKSPSISYVNMGNPYVPTIMWIKGRYRVACWGDVIQRGNYD